MMKLKLISVILISLLFMGMMSTKVTQKNKDVKVNGAIFIKPAAASSLDIPASEIPFTDIPSRFRAVNDWAIKHGYFSGYPNFHQTFNHGLQETVYGTILIKKGAASSFDIPASEIPFTDIPSRFRAVHDWAVKHGYEAGYPNFHQAFNHDIQQTVYGTILIKKGYAVHRDIRASEIPFTDIASRFRAVNDRAIGNEYFSGFPNFYESSLTINLPELRPMIDKISSNPQGDILEKRISFFLDTDEKFTGKFYWEWFNTKSGQWDRRGYLYHYTRFDTYFMLCSSPIIVNDRQIDFRVLNFDVEGGDRNPARQLLLDDAGEFFNGPLKTRFPTAESHTNRKFRIYIEVDKK